jgi:hypothetical protein
MSPIVAFEVSRMGVAELIALAPLTQALDEAFQNDHAEGLLTSAGAARATKTFLLRKSFLVP